MENAQVTLNMSTETLNDIDQINSILKNSTKTEIVGKAIRFYKILRHKQDVEGKQIQVKHPNGNVQNYIIN